MGRLALSDKAIEKYFNFLNSLDNRAKQRLIVKLTNSIDFEPKKPFNIRSIAGKWVDNRTSDEIIEDIRQSRIE